MAHASAAAEAAAAAAADDDDDDADEFAVTPLFVGMVVPEMPLQSSTRACCVVADDTAALIILPRSLGFERRRWHG